MDTSEVIVLLASCFLAGRYLFIWYRAMICSISLKRSTLLRISLCLLPAASVAIIWYTLVNLSSFDVIGSGFWRFFYILIGIMWLYIGKALMFVFFDVSWVDDAVDMANPAAALAVIGGSLGITIIYAGANIGDGPGWWCVFFAGGLGLVAWIALGKLVDAVTHIFRQITVGRDVPCAIRAGTYLLSSGIILGRASAGDWTSFSQTVVEFGVCWPVLVLTAVFILVEVAFRNSNMQSEQSKAARLFSSLFLSAVYMIASIATIYVLSPLPVNPIYGN